MALTKKTLKFIEKKCSCDLSGKTILVTGANSGVGFKTCEILITRGASIIMACRSLERAAKARDELLKEYPQASIELVQLDISDFSSIDQFAASLPQMDVFINNAGVFHHPGEFTKDGFPMVMGTNYFGVYYLSQKILPVLELRGKDVTYINTISLVHKFAKMDYEHFFDEKKQYSRSKLSLTRYTEWLVKKYKGTNVHVMMNHPGISITQIAAHMFGKFYFIAKLLPFNSAEKSSLSAVWILSHSLEDGTVVGPDRLFGGWGYPKVNRKVKRALVGLDELVEFTEKCLKEREASF